MHPIDEQHMLINIKQMNFAIQEMLKLLQKINARLESIEQAIDAKS